MKKIDDRLENIEASLKNIDVHMAVYNQQLKEHMRRTEILEAQVAEVDDHVKSVRAVIKFILWASGSTLLIRWLSGK